MSAPDTELARLVAAHRRVRRPDPELRAQVAEAVAADARRERTRRIASSTAVAIGLAAAALLLMYLARGMMLEREPDPRRDQAVYGERGDAASGTAREGVHSASGAAQSGPRTPAPAVSTAEVPPDAGGDSSASEAQMRQAEPVDPTADAAAARPEAGATAASVLERAGTPAAASSKRPAVADNGTREIQLLRDAEVALTTAPAQALKLLRDHTATYPRSSFAEEREALFILALCKTGAHAQARPRQAEFLRQHPRSPYAARIRAACDEAKK